MGKYLLLWELDPTKVPLDQKERAAAWALLMNMVKQDMEKGVSKDWGVFPGEGKGYAVAEGTELDVMIMTQQYTPYVSFAIHPVATVSQVDELLEAMSQ